MEKLSIIEIQAKDLIRNHKEEIAYLIGNGWEIQKAVDMVLKNSVLGNKYKNKIRNKFLKSEEK